jgi:E3 ubiquitin-protein ligase RNF115/126
MNESSPISLYTESRPRLSTYWCHTCRVEFSPPRTSPDAAIACPTCKGDFCEEIIPNEDNPKDFVPYESTEITRTNTNTQPMMQPSTSTAAGMRQQQQHYQTRVMNNPMSQVYVFSSTGQMNNANMGGGNNMIGNLLSNLFSNSMPGLFQQVSEEHSMEQIIQYLIDHDHNQYGPPPASKQVIDRLPLRKVSKEIICKEGIQECSVCKEEFKEEEDVKEMPCKHLFHNDCLLPWLKQHNSCPTCRFELPTDDIDYENRKQFQQNNNNNNSNNRTNTNTRR